LEFKTLFIGMVISMAAFSVKAGLGTAYLCRSRPPGRRMGALFAAAASYGALFAAVYFIAARVNVIANYEKFIPLLRGGVAMHWLTAIFIFVWGLALLKMCGSDARRRGKACLALVIPCPVCMSVVLMSASCLALYFPDNAVLSLAGLYLAFAALAGTSAAFALLTKITEQDAERSLGSVMILTAAYFMVSALVTPQFSEIGRIYRLAAYSRDTGIYASAEEWKTRGAVILIFAIGFGCAEWRMRRGKKIDAAAKTAGYGGSAG
jgi:predicted transporter